MSLKPTSSTSHSSTNSPAAAQQGGLQAQAQVQQAVAPLLHLAPALGHPALALLVLLLLLLLRTPRQASASAREGIRCWPHSSACRMS
jgi:hypothetical protein